MYIITIASLKGGVGKTTIAVNLALHIAKRKKKVLAIDLDVNNNLTDFFLKDTDEKKIDRANVFHVLTDESEIEDCIYKSEFGLDVLPSTVALSNLHRKCGGDFVTLLSFEGKLLPLEYDFVIIDTPPYLAAELRLAMWISDLVMSPVQPVRWVFQGTEFLINELELSSVTGLKNPDRLLVPSMVGKSKTEEERLKVLRKKHRFTKASIGKLSAIRTATETGKPLKENSKAYETFESLAKEVLEMAKAHDLAGVRA